MDRKTFVEGLMQQHGVTREDAERAADRMRLGVAEAPPSKNRSADVQRIVGASSREAPIPTVSLPFKLLIPWSELCSDNEKSVPYVRRVRGGNVVPGQKRSPRYQAAFVAIKGRARQIAGDRLPVDGIALELHARVYLPPARRNDAINFSKCLNDALEGVVYMNDNQLHRQVWERAGVDIDAPRAEITISRLQPSHRAA